MRTGAWCASAILAAAVATVRCTAWTHAEDYAVGGLCAACASRPDLRHAPCRTGTGPAQPEGVYFFALRSVDLGADPAEWVDGYGIGIDQDCSDRPDGMPILCAPTTRGPWISLPGGVDNSLAAQTFASDVTGTRLGGPIQQTMNREIQAGKWGYLLVIDGWNGTDNDDGVGVRLVYTHGAVAPDGGATPPHWDGTDVWNTFAQACDPTLPGCDPTLSCSGVPDSAVKGGTAYVTAGQLVWDGSAINGATLRLENNASAGVGAIEIDLANLALIGTLSPQGISHGSLSGLLPTSTAHVYPDFLLGNPGNAAICAFREAYRPLVDANPLAPEWAGPIAPDMPTPGTSADVNAPCSSVSVGLGLEFVRTGGACSDPDPPPAPTYVPYACDGGTDGG